MTFDSDLSIQMIPGHLYIIPPETTFGCSTLDPIDHFYVHYTFRNAMDCAKGRPYVLEPSTGLDQMMNHLIKEHEADICSEGDLSGALITLAAGLVFLIHSSLPSGGIPQKHKDELVQQACVLIDTGRMDKLANLPCSERTLRRRFQKETGQTPREYDINHRITQACMLLHFSDLSVEEVAIQTGFCDRYHLSRVFSRYRGMGPATYRNIMNRTYPEGFQAKM